MQMSGRQVHRAGAMALSILMALIGAALMVQAFFTPASIFARLLLGALFLAAGIGRLYVELRRGRKA